MQRRCIGLLTLVWSRADSSMDRHEAVGSQPCSEGRVPGVDEAVSASALATAASVKPHEGLPDDPVDDRPEQAHPGLHVHRVDHLGAPLRDRGEADGRGVVTQGAPDSMR